ncbi:MAG: HAMP domain-containing histidine kinase [Chloroflexi bacterium]|nr:HAMP domain-containing histidine kinase [Chloroflexota bacterium]
MTTSHPLVQTLRRILATLQDSGAALEAIAEAEAALTELERELAAAQEEKAKFVSVVTHELRLPMTSIQGYTDLLRQGAMGAVNENQLNFLNVIRSNVHRMNALITSLSDMTKAEAGRLAVETSPQALSPLAAKAIEAKKEVLAEFQQTVEDQIPGDLPPVQADPARVQQVIEHLLDNAAKYADPGGTITVGAEDKGERVRLTVHDRGYGIPPEEQDKVFEPFYRSDDQRVRDRHGWGLGLPLCRRLLALMSGSVGLESRPGEGTTVWLDLPKA